MGAIITWYGLPEIVRPLWVNGLARLLPVIPFPGKIVVECFRGELVGPYGPHGWEAHVELAPALIRSPYNGLGRDLGLKDGGTGCG
jgi:hypothetical protein